MFFISALIIAISSLFFSANMKFKSRISYLLTIYIFGYGSIALIGNLGHFLSLLGSRFYFLVTQFILLLVVITIWTRIGRPNLFGPFKNSKYLIRTIDRKKFFKQYPDLTLMFLGVTIGYILLAFVWYQVPPNNNDSISTHMPRVIYWIQHGNFEPWDTGRIFQLMYPVNSGLQYLWSILLSKSDHWVGLVQWSAAIVSALSIYGIAGMMGAKFPWRLYSGLIFLTLPSVIMQSTTTQNDLTAAGLFGVFFYFLLKTIKKNTINNIFCAAIPLGLVVGTKQTILYLLPGLVLLLLIYWLYFKSIQLKKILLLIGISILTFLMIGSVIFFINADYFGHPLGRKEVVNTSIQATESIQTSISQIGLNSTRFLFQMVDPTGLSSPLWRWGIKIRAIAGGELFRLLNIPIEADIYNTWPHKFSLSKAYLFQEDESWFGILGFFILIPTFVIQSIMGFVRKEPIRISIFILSITFMIFLTLLRPGWDPYQGRYFLPIVLICSALSYTWFSNKLLRWIMGPLTLVFGMMILYNGILFNPAKPIVDRPIPIFYRYPEDPGYEQIRRGTKIDELNRLEKISLQTFSNYRLCEIVEQNVPIDATLGYAISENYYQEYCFFGENFTRKLLPIYPIEKVRDESILLENEIDYLLLFKASNFQGISLDHFTEIASSLEIDVMILKNDSKK
jgi:hypothetical protein